MRTTGEDTEAVCRGGGGVCRRSPSAPEQSWGVASTSHGLGKFPSHLLFSSQHKSQTSKSRARGPGPEDDRIPRADLPGGEDIQVQPVQRERRDSPQRHWQVFSVADLLGVSSWVGFPTDGELRSVLESVLDHFGPLWVYKVDK